MDCLSFKLCLRHLKRRETCSSMLTNVMGLLFNCVTRLWNSCTGQRRVKARSDDASVCNSLLYRSHIMLLCSHCSSLSSVTPNCLIIDPQVTWPDTYKPSYTQHTVLLLCEHLLWGMSSRNFQKKRLPCLGFVSDVKLIYNNSDNFLLCSWTQQKTFLCESAVVQYSFQTVLLTFKLTTGN